MPTEIRHMAEVKNSTFMIENVEARYPKLDQPYRFDTGKNSSVPCSATDDNAEYSLDFLMPQATAKALFTAMKSAYGERKQKGWPALSKPTWQKNDDDKFIGRAKLKAAYSGNPTAKPQGYDAQTNRLPDGFRLTTGSTVNIHCELVPYSGTMGHGVSLRLRAIQVIDLAPEMERNPFSKVEGFTASDNPFTAKPVEEVAEGSDDIFGEEAEEEEAEEEKVEEPVVRKKAKSSKPAEEKEDLAAIIDDWDD